MTKLAINESQIVCAVRVTPFTSSKILHENLNLKIIIRSTNKLLNFQVPVKSWFDDTTDSELLDLIPLFEKLSKVDSVYSVLCNSNQPIQQTGSPPNLNDIDNT